MVWQRETNIKLLTMTTLTLPVQLSAAHDWNVVTPASVVAWLVDYQQHIVASVPASCLVLPAVLLHVPDHVNIKIQQQDSKDYIIPVLVAMLLCVIRLHIAPNDCDTVLKAPEF